MKLLLISDIHSEFENLRKILETTDFDAILIAGDITHFRPADVLKADSIFAQYSDSCFAVHGNCDYEEMLKYECDAIKFIHRHSVKFDDLALHGIGGSGITPFDTPSEYSEEEIRRMLLDLKLDDSRMNFLLSHCPPKGVLDKTYSGLHAGCEAIREHARSFDVVVCGHIHEAHGVEGMRDGEKLAINPGPVIWRRYALLDTVRMNVELRKI